MNKRLTLYGDGPAPLVTHEELRDIIDTSWLPPDAPSGFTIESPWEPPDGSVTSSEAASRLGISLYSFRRLATLRGWREAGSIPRGSGGARAERYWTPEFIASIQSDPDVVLARSKRRRR